MQVVSLSAQLARGTNWPAKMLNGSSESLLALPMFLQQGAPRNGLTLKDGRKRCKATAVARCARQFTPTQQPITPRSDGVEPRVSVDVIAIPGYRSREASQGTSDMPKVGEELSVEIGYCSALKGMNGASRETSEDKTAIEFESSQVRPHPCWTELGEVSGSIITSYSRSMALWSVEDSVLDVDLTGSASTIASTSRFMLHPKCRRRMAWDLLGMLLVLYDFVMLPMQAFPLGRGLMMLTMDWIGAVFWSLDIVVNFRTGVYDKRSFIDFSPCNVARRYGRTWFLLDLFVVIAGWVSLLLKSTATLLSSAAALRVFRVLRFLRLTRALKMWQALMEHIRTYSNNSTALIQLLNIMKRLWSLLLVNHFVACMWYVIGDFYDGWVPAKAEVISEELANDISYWYLTSLHWSISQFIGSMEINPQNVQERLYAVVVLLLALIICSTLISSITTMMVEVEAAYRDQKETSDALRDFLHSHCIDKDLRVLAKKELEQSLLSGSHHQSQAKLLASMPSKLRIRLQLEIRLKIVQCHWLFSSLLSSSRDIIVGLCHKAMRDVPVQAGEFEFVADEVCKKMYFVLRGELQYELHERDAEHQLDSIGIDGLLRAANALAPNYRRLLLAPGKHMIRSIVGKKTVVSEAVLWTSWSHVGGLSSTHPESSLVALDPEIFTELVLNSVAAREFVQPYAYYFVRAMNEEGCTDLGLGQLPGHDQVHATSRLGTLSHLTRTFGAGN